VLDLLLPQRCLVCASSGAQVCAACLERLPRLRAPLCARCGAPTSSPVARCRECSGRRLAFASARAAVAYDAAVKRLVSAWKEQSLRRFAVLAADVVAEALPRPDAAALVPVPGDRDRGLRRGHQPAGRLAAELAKRWQLPAEPLLARTRESPPQRALALEDRRRNVAGAFAPAARVPPRVVLVDDVYTTGATVAAAASALRRGGARRVDVVTFARTIRTGMS
jgi:ComF family protein